MQHLGDAPQTMGYIFAMVGVGCLVGPLVLNPWVPPRVPLLLAACAGSLTLLSISYAVMLAAPGIGLVLLSTFIRALGEGVYVSEGGVPGGILLRGFCCEGTATPIKYWARLAQAGPCSWA